MQPKGHDPTPSNFPGQMPATDDEIREKYLERAIRELNRLTHDLQECELCPRGRPDAGARLGASAGGRVPAEVRAERVGGRGGGRVLRPQRRRADEELQAARHRPADGLRDAVREVPGRRSRPGGRGVRRAARRGDRGRAAADRRGDGTARARDAQRPRAAARAARSSRGSARSSSSRPRSRRCTCPTSTGRSTRSARSASSGRRSARSATGTPTCRPTRSWQPANVEVLHRFWELGHGCAATFDAGRWTLVTRRRGVRLVGLARALPRHLSEAATS